MSKRNPDLLIDDILKAIEKIHHYTNGFSFEKFEKDDKTIDAVVRNFEIIGEAARQLPEDFKNQNTNIEWYKIIGFRNRIVHEYFGVDLEIIWEIITKQLTDLETQIKSILK